MLKIPPAFSVLHDENQPPIEFGFYKASFFNKTFQKVFLKGNENKNLEPIDKDCIEMKIFISNDQIIKSMKY